MSSSSDTPRVRRRTVTLTHDKILKEVQSSEEVRIIRAGQSSGSTLSQSNQATPAKSNNIFQERAKKAPTAPPHQSVSNASATVLVINASQETAQEITLELSRTLPGCSILFAPTLQLALWILKRRSIDIILSSALLPDGPLSRLHESLEAMSPPPELVILSDLTTTRAELGSHPGYRFVELRRMQPAASNAKRPAGSNITQISALGADSKR
jgi:hypothetical protein